MKKANKWWRDPYGGYRNSGLHIENIDPQQAYPFAPVMRWRLVQQDGQVVGRFRRLAEAKLVGDKILSLADI